MTNKQKIVIAINGASGMLYAQRLLNKLATSDAVQDIGVVFSKNAESIWISELNKPLPTDNKKITIYNSNDFSAPFASGSAQYNSMIICPASMGIVGRIAGGISNCLITRAADVILKERRKLIVVPRETPYNLIHLKNMETITLAGGIICPANPSFYNNPKSIEEVIDTVVNRILDLLKIPNDAFRWGE
ncbi:MAG: UbiX family flavin prenyltransferase [Salinivirgaceae bacterium]|nr:UbiX family flavin prenyltransferase [Salinivirgaceae bacterium]MDD4747657.1 UbiX family flavin prenyltransferase [Salinivirgaceae bacterium]MDY0280891.1 UbiX family flavin prenyltransferase [Salinivirgaceae bacterium]